MNGCLKTDVRRAIGNEEGARADELEWQIASRPRPRTGHGGDQMSRLLLTRQTIDKAPRTSPALRTMTQQAISMGSDEGMHRHHLQGVLHDPQGSSHRSPHKAALIPSRPTGTKHSKGKGKHKYAQRSSRRKKPRWSRSRESQTYLDNHLGLEASFSQQMTQLQYRSGGSFGRARVSRR